MIADYSSEIKITIQSFIFCHGNQLILGAVRRRRHEWPLLVALAFDNGLGNRNAALKRFNDNNPATSCTNLVNFCLIDPQFLPRFGRNLTTIFIRHLGVPKRIESSQFW